MSCGAEISKRRGEQASFSGGIRAAINRRLSRPAVYDSPETSKASELQLADCQRIIEELNSLVANFRDLLIHVGKGHDCPEVRDKMKVVRKKCVERCSAANRVLMPQIRSDVAEGIPVDNQHLVNLVCCTQLLLREIHKCRLLVMAHPMDMTNFYERRPRSSGVAVLDKLILWRAPLHDYHQEELVCIQRDMETISAMLNEMLDFMPQETGDELFDLFPLPVDYTSQLYTGTSVGYLFKMNHLFSLRHMNGAHYLKVLQFVVNPLRIVFISGGDGESGLSTGSVVIGTAFIDQHPANIKQMILF